MPWSPTAALESEAEALPAQGDRGTGERAGAVVSRLAGSRVRYCSNLSVSDEPHNNPQSRKRQPDGGETTANQGALKSGAQTPGQQDVFRGVYCLRLPLPGCWVKNTCPGCTWSKSGSERNGQLRNALSRGTCRGGYSRNNMVHGAR